MSDQKISQLPLATALDPNAIIPFSLLQNGAWQTQAVNASTLWAAGGIAAAAFSFPNDGMTPITTADIGKLAMNDGSATAKVYQISGPASAVPGVWTIQFNSTNYGGLNSSSSITITLPGDNNNISLSQSDWRNGQTPIDAAAELGLISTAISNGLSTSNSQNGTAFSLSPSIAGDTLTIAEGTIYEGFVISVNNWPSNSFTVVQRALAACPAAPTAFPLGKILDVQNNGNVLISAAYVETYTLSTAATLDQSVFNTETYAGLTFDATGITAMLKNIAVPDSNGTVKPFDLSAYAVNNEFTYSMRDQLVGLMLCVNGNTATVLHLNAFGPILNGVFKTIWYNSTNS